MCNSCDYTIHGRHHHFGWDNSLAPAERLAPGSTVEFECLDASGGQLTANSTVEDVGRLDFALGCTLVHVGMVLLLVVMFAQRMQLIRPRFGK